MQKYTLHMHRETHSANLSIDFSYEELKAIYNLVDVAETNARGNAQRKVRKNSWTEKDKQDNQYRCHLLSNLIEKLKRFGFNFSEY